MQCLRASLVIHFLPIVSYTVGVYAQQYHGRFITSFLLCSGIRRLGRVCAGQGLAAALVRCTTMIGTGEGLVKCHVSFSLVLLCFVVFVAATGRRLSRLQSALQAASHGIAHLG